MSWRALSLGVALCAVAQTHAQQPAAPPPTFRSGVSMVELVAVVTGEDGRSLTDLTAADFEVREDGELRPLSMVRKLSAAAAPGRTTSPAAVPGASIERLATNTTHADSPAFVLLLDDLDTSPYDSHRLIRGALGAFNAIPEGALVEVLTTSGIDGGLLTLGPPAPAHAERIRAFRGQLILAGPPSRSAIHTTPSPVSAPCGAGSNVTQSPDCSDPTRAARRAQVLDAVGQILSRAGTRRKVLLWFTETMGVSTIDRHGSQKAQRAALRRLLNADVAVYPINPREGEADFRDPTDAHQGVMTDNRPDRRSGGKLRVGVADSQFGGSGASVIDLDTDDMVAVPLAQLARATGGRWITNANNLELRVAEVVEQNTTAYALAFESPLVRVAGTHALDVRVRRPGARVYARQGYRVDAAAAAVPSSESSSLLRDTLSGSAPLGSLPIIVHAAPLFAAGGSGTVIVTIGLDAPAGTGQAIDLAVATVDDRGRATPHQTLRLAPPPPGDPWEVVTEVTLAKGRHQLRVAGVTADQTRTGLVLAPIEIVEPGRALLMTPPVLLDTTSGRVHPTAVRTFAVGKRLGIQVEVAGRPVQDRAAHVRVSLADAGGRAVRSAEALLDPGRAPDRQRATAVVATESLAPGEYLLMTEARGGRGVAVRRGVRITLNAPIPASPGSPGRTDAADGQMLAHSVVAHGPTPMPGAGTFVIRSSAEWTAFWQHLPTRQPAPDIDFDRVTLLAIVTDAEAPGARPQVERVVDSGDATLVRWRMELSSPATGAAARAFVVVGLQKRVAEVRFERVPR